MTALYHLLAVGDHVVPQIVKAQFVVGAVGDIAGIGRAAGRAVHLMGDEADAQTEEPVELAHPLGVAPSQIVVDRDHMDAVAGQRVEVDRQRRDKGLALAGLHLGDLAAMEHDAADDLNREVTHPQHPVGGLAAGREGVGQDVVQRFAVGQPLFQCRGDRLQLCIRKRLVVILQREHLVRDGTDLFQLLIGKAAENLFEKSHLITA